MSKRCIFECDKTCKCMHPDHKRLRKSVVSMFGENPACDYYGKLRIENSLPCYDQIKPEDVPLDAHTYSLLAGA